MALFYSARPKDATKFLVTILFAKSPKFVRGSSPIAAHCKCCILLLEQSCGVIKATTCIYVSKLC